MGTVNIEIMLKGDEIMKENKKIIPIFYACDTNYLPYLSVSLISLKKHAKKSFLYRIYILHSGIEENKQLPILSLHESWFVIEFVNVNERLNKVNNSLQLRDYYTASTYYRMFIADMFLEYDKALYIDSDTVILNDIEKLYNKKIKDNYVGAITDGVVSGNEIFEKYTKEVLGIKAKRYFNAGVLIMNLKKFRKENFYKQFVDLLRKYRFVVAQDQDYLNVICKDKIKYLANKWNTMPIKEKSKKSPSLIHYNLTLKPWHYVDIPYAECFWKYAKESYYYDDIRKEFGNYNTQKIKSDEKTELSLLDLALSEIKKEDNYIKLVKKEQDTVSQFINQEGTVNQNAI